ncbi:hypothetical protein AF72_11355 [Xylella taiwanensis]|uniref:Uncharacterized protein n=1 Tax=Xylella taiwanensis TaxID=1444770 RepID=Z9JHX0_9GAMM|nr:hypothetical protein AF72_11355 [Xylella taiwanensis]
MDNLWLVGAFPAMEQGTVGRRQSGNDLFEIQTRGDVICIFAVESVA